jgi:hypothetical protein
MRLLLVAAVSLLAGACGSVPQGDRDADVRELLRLHEEVMVAHRKGDASLIFSAEGDEYVIVSRGEISHPDLAKRREFFGPYLSSTRFSVYRDQVPAIVRVSADGSLGWVIAQVEARGEQGAAQPARKVEFVSAWIELYEKREGRWRRVGNVSNFKG